MTWNLFVLLCLLSGGTLALVPLLAETNIAFLITMGKWERWENHFIPIHFMWIFTHSMSDRIWKELRAYLGEPESGVSRKGPFRASLVAGRLRKGWQDTLWGLQLWHMVCLHRVTDVNDLIGQRAPRAVSLQEQPTVVNFGSWYKNYSSKNPCYHIIICYLEVMNLI